MFTMKLDQRPVIQLENDLDRFGEKTLPFAVRETLNTAAFKTRKLATTVVEKKFTLRNSFTKRSIQYRKVGAHRIDDMFSEVGSTQEYMAKQETGFTTRKSGKHGIAIPTPEASGEGQARVRKRPIRRTNQLSRINIAKGLSGEYRRAYGNAHQRLTRMVQDSIEYGHRVLFWKSDNDRRTGFYRIVGGKRTKRGWPEGAKLQFLYGVNQETTVTENGEWLQPATDITRKQMGSLYRQALLNQIRRNRNFRNR